MNNFIKYWSYLIENENKEISFESYILSEDKKTYIQKHQNEEDFNQEIFDKYWNEIRSRIKGKPEADIDKYWMNKPFKEMANFVNNFDNRNQKERKIDKDKEDAIKAGAHYLGDMEAKNGITYEIWIPASHKSANILRNIYKGGNDIGTAWCISVAGSDSHWNDYIDEGSNFIFLINKDPILSKTDYRIDDKIAVEIEPDSEITLWDMNDDDETLNINNFKSIIDFAFEKGEADKLFPNDYAKYKKITIGGQIFRIRGPSIFCSDKNLTSLVGSPQKVGGYFDCTENQLTSLEGAPKKVDGYFNCSHNKLTSLKGGPKEVGGFFDCANNQITSLEGAPEKVGRDFWCTNNMLTSLEGAPKYVGEDFVCHDNKLTSLKGAPQKVGGYFDCTENQLTSLEGAPQWVGRSVFFSDNPDLSEYKIKAYKAYLKLSDSEKAPLTKNGHYYPTEEWENKFR